MLIVKVNLIYNLRILVFWYSEKKGGTITDFGIYIHKSNTFKNHKSITKRLHITIIYMYCE